MWTQEPALKENKDGINYVQSVKGKGLSEDKLVQGCNSGYQAINLAKLLDYETVLLLGYDMHGIGQHWFGKHDGSKGMSTNTNYSNFIREYENMQPEKHGLEVINCTRETALLCFPRMTFEEAVATYG